MYNIAPFCRKAMLYKKQQCKPLKQSLEIPPDTNEFDKFHCHVATQDCKHTHVSSHASEMTSMSWVE